VRWAGLVTDANGDRHFELLDAIVRYLIENVLRSLVSTLRVAVAGRSFTLYA
jgi:hypothetical protein